MSLTITGDMIIELAEMTSPRGTDTKIVLTEQGWDTVVDTNNTYPAGLTAFTRADLEDLADGEDIDTSLAEHLATQGPYGGDYTIHTETGGDGDWRVVTPEIDPDDHEPAWASAWAFNLNTATEIVAEEPWRSTVDGQVQDRTRVTSLYRTEGGAWVMHTRSQWENEQDTWTEVTPRQAAEYAYRAEPDLITEDPPALIAAAAKAAELAALITAPEIPVDGDEQIATGKAWRRREHAAETVRDGAVIADLIHEHVVADIKRQRAQAARVAVMAYGTQTAAAEELGMLQPRLNKLLNHDA